MSAERRDRFWFVAADVVVKGMHASQWFYFAGGPDEAKREFEIYKQNGDTVVVRFECWMTEVTKWEPCND